MLFAYMYIIGVALGYLYPQPQGYTRYYLTATALFALLTNTPAAARPLTFTAQK